LDSLIKIPHVSETYTKPINSKVNTAYFLLQYYDGRHFENRYIAIF